MLKPKTGESARDVSRPAGRTEESTPSIPFSPASTDPPQAAPDIDELINQLTSRQFALRRHARETLVRMGERAVPSLIKSLSGRNSQLRWRVAKALIEIGDPRAADALVACLDDKDAGTRWVMAEAVIALGRDALAPLLRALIARSDSFAVLEGAHHVLHQLPRGPDREILHPVLIALEGPAPADAAPVAAAEALEKLEAQEG
jgi:HEAT repeat protein